MSSFIFPLSSFSCSLYCCHHFRLRGFWLQNLSDRFTLRSLNPSFNPSFNPHPFKSFGRPARGLLSLCHCAVLSFVFRLFLSTYVPTQFYSPSQRCSFTGYQGSLNQINSLRFTNTGKKICAVSNDGSLNVWAYPISPRPRPQPQPEIHHESTANESGEKVELRLTVPETSTLATSPPASGLDREGEGEVGRDKEQETEGKSRAGSPSSRSRDGDNDEERERERESEGDRERGREGGEGDVSMTDIEPETLNPEVEPISKAESTDRPSEAPVEDVDVEMSLSEPPPTSEADTSEAITNGSNLLEPTGNGSKLLEPTATSTQEILPTHSQLPTRESSPTLQTPITTTQTQNGSIPNPNSHTNITASPNNLTSSEGETTKRQLRQLTRLRHEIYHSASLLSLSFDPLGR